MPIPDDEGFETYLRRFRPLAPEPLPARGSGQSYRRRFALWAGAAAAVAILAGTIALDIHTERNRVAETTRRLAIPDQLVDGPPLTMRSANALMAKAPSFKALIDDMAFRSQTISIPKGKLSAVAVLGKEKIKL